MTGGPLATSWLLASATLPVTLPVAGLNTSAGRPLLPGTTAPPIQWSMEAMAPVVLVGAGAFMVKKLLEGWSRPV